MNGLAIGAGITVITVMFTAVTLLPAVLSLLGRKGVRVEDAVGTQAERRVPRWKASPKYGDTLQKRPWLYGCWRFFS